MSRPALPPAIHDILTEILGDLQEAEADAIDGANQKGEADSSFPYIAGYLGAVVKMQATRLERLLALYPNEAKTP